MHSPLVRSTGRLHSVTRPVATSQDRNHFGHRFKVLVSFRKLLEPDRLVCEPLHFSELRGVGAFNNVRSGAWKTLLSHMDDGILYPVVPTEVIQVTL